jgi:uncharacterized repeat protein (TIGR01451 family)
VRWTIKLALALSLLFFLAPHARPATVAQSPEQALKWQALSPEMQAKIDPRILAELEGRIVPTHLAHHSERAMPSKEQTLPRQTRFLVHLQAQTDFQDLGVQAQATLAERRATVADKLLSTARATQAPVKAVLDRGVERGTVAGYMPFYVFNGFAVQGDLNTVFELAARADVARLSANYRLIRSGSTGSGELARSLAATEPAIAPENWNIGLVGAEQVWSQLGITGQGAVVASFDTGVDWDHPALRSTYRGANGGPIDHNYNWFEFNSSSPQYWNPSGDYGPSQSNAPYDCDDHGTHTTGIMVGEGETSGSQIGMAPGAAWIAVPGICGRTMPGGYQDDIGGIRTFQWLMCPTDLSGALSTRDCSQAPDVINNSWGSSNPADTTFEPIIQALRAAGILPIFAAGNPAAGLGSIGSPASLPDAISVGATDRNDQVTAFSGRGPSLYPGVQKPELSAPGAGILSSVPGDGYRTKSGSSMAAPHVSGLAALMISADLRDGRRSLDTDQILNAMALTAVDLGPDGPDADYGYGRINAFEAVRWVLGAGLAQITARDTNTGAPLPDTTITLTSAPGTQHYTARTDASGGYTFSVPDGTYSAQVKAYGYAVHTVDSFVVSTGRQTTLNVQLTPLSAGTLTGRVLSGQVPVPDARLYVDGVPNYQTYSIADGSFSLRLPVGTHELTLVAQGYRIAHLTVNIPGGIQELDVDLVKAPTLLLVEADGYKGWYEGRPARQFFQWALDSRDYLYDTAVITDTATLPQLASYDLIIWAHTVGSPGTGGFGSNGVLQEYLDRGGRMILSGQNIGYWDQWRESDVDFYHNYLRASFFQDDAAQEEDTVSGSHFLSGIHLTLKDSAQYAYPNTVATLSPDAVKPLDGNAYSVLSYDNGNESAALAIDPCDSPYRVVYMGVGYENLGPRADSRPPEFAELLDRAIQWAIESKPSHDVSVSLAPDRQSAPPGTTLRYDLTVANTGFLPDAYDLTLSGNEWPTHLLNGRTQVVSTGEIAPCASTELVIKVDIPLSAEPDDQDTFTIEATSRSEPPVRTRAEIKTTALSTWQTAKPMPTPRYRLAAASLPNSSYYYAMGGFGGETLEKEMGANERYDACSDQWQRMASMPTPRGNVSAAAIGNEIYVAGGYASDSQLDVLEIYHVPGDTWRQGPSLPEPISGAAVAAWDDKLYLFGGTRPGGTVSDKTYVYDPALRRWTELAPMPGGARSFAAAATLNDKIYVAGGWYVSRVEIYDPITDSWSQAAPLNFARQSPGMAAAPDGKLYVAGGGDDWWTGLRTTERYDPILNRWQILDTLTDGHRAGAALAYTDGRVFCTGGVDNDLSRTHESLQLAHSFCQSSKHLATDVRGLVQPGDTLTYTIALHSNQTDLQNAAVIDPIPEGTTFVGFTSNHVGAIYSADRNQVEWQDTLAGDSPAQRFTYAVDVHSTGWDHGDQIVNQARFETAAGQSFTRAVTVTVDYADPSPSTKRVSHDLARPGEALTYTLHIENASLVSDVFHLVDPLPAHTTYLTDSLSFGSGQGAYDPEHNQITWSGVLPLVISYTIDGYQWGDSSGGGTLPGVEFSWQDMRNATDTQVDADDGVFGPFPIGFDFGFYDAQHDSFYVSPNGWVGFESSTGPGIVSCTDYGGASQPDAFIGGFGGDRAILSADGASIRYKLIGSRPSRILVVEFARMRHFYNLSDDLADMQIWLYEGSNEILVQYQNLTTSPAASHNGLEGAAPDYPTVSYQDRCPSTVGNRLAVRYQPIRIPHYTRSTEVTFAVTPHRDLASYTWITNTASLSSSLVSVQRSASTLVNPVDLSTSAKTVDKLFAAPGEQVSYQLRLFNNGQLEAKGVTLTDPIPEHTAYVKGSLACSAGTCGYTDPEDKVRWSGEIAGGSEVTLSFAVTVAADVEDAMPIVNQAVLAQTTGQEHILQAAFVARNSDLSLSTKEASALWAEPGDRLTYTVKIRNSAQVDTVAEMQDWLPDQASFVPNSLECASGTCSYADGVISWQGAVPGLTLIPIRFQVRASDAPDLDSWMVNTATITDTNRALAYPVTSRVRLWSPAWQAYLPLIPATP